MATRSIDPAQLRTVHLMVGAEAFKALYWDREQLGLRPNLVFVDDDGTVSFETNEAGLKGDPLDPARKTAVVWGDSVVFGHRRSWPCLLDDLAPAYQFLNGGLEGDPFGNILRRADAFNRRCPVALNLLMPGWHPFMPSEPRPRARWRRHGKRAGANDEIAAALTAFLKRWPTTVVLTMPTALNPQIIDRDLSDRLFEGDYENTFRFLGHLPYRVDVQRLAYAHIIERNAIAREVCIRRSARLVDLFAALDTTGSPDFRENFIDLVHLRPRAYRLVARIVYDGIKDLLDRPLNASVEPASA